jgi:hypothetical protein
MLRSEMGLALPPQKCMLPKQTMRVVCVQCEFQGYFPSSFLEDNRDLPGLLTRFIG